MESGNVFEADEDEYVLVSTVQDPLEQGQICSFLQAYDIPTRVRSHGLRETYGLTAGGAAGILVPSDLADAARDLLARADHGDLSIDE